MSVPAGVAHRGMITVSIMLATIMQALDTTIANVALPHMQGSLQASQDQITWVLTSYIVAAAIATPLTGWLCGHWGRRKVFLVSVVGFTVASALCGMADLAGEIVAARLLQGVFGAALVPLSQAVLLDINPKREGRPGDGDLGRGHHGRPDPRADARRLADRELRLALGLLHQPAGRACSRFYGILRYLPESRPHGERLDIFGFVTLSLAIGLLQLFLDRGEQLDWFGSGEIRLEAAGAAGRRSPSSRCTPGPSPGRPFFDRALLQGPQLRHRPAVRLHRRRGAVRHDGAAADDAAGPDGLPGALHRRWSPRRAASAPWSR